MSHSMHGKHAFVHNAERRLQAVLDWVASRDTSRPRMLVAVWNMRALRREAACAGAPRLARLCERMEIAISTIGARQDRLWQERRDARLRIACGYLATCARSLRKGEPAPEAPLEIVRWLEPPLPRPAAIPEAPAPELVTVTVAEGVVCLRVSRPGTLQEQLSLIWRLQRMHVEALPYKEWIIDLSQYREVPSSLLAAVEILEQRLMAVGCRYRLALPGRPAGCPSRDFAWLVRRHDAARGPTARGINTGVAIGRRHGVTNLNARRTGVNAIKADLEQLVLEHIETLYNVAMQLTNDIDIAEALTERALIRAFRCGLECIETRPIKSWLLTLLRTTYMEEFAGDQVGEPCYAGDDCLSSRGIL